jgi:hypothetical protein
MSGIRSGVNGTPTFYINGIRYDDSWDEETLLSSIKQEVTDMQQHPTSKASQRTTTRKTDRGVPRRTKYKK